MDENSSGKVMRDLIQMYTAKKFMELTHKEIRRAEVKLENYFAFIDNTRRYEIKEVTDLFLKSGADCLLIDPFNALKTELTYSSNYEVLNELKLITKQSNYSIFINAHPVSATGRLSATYPKEHEWNGQVRIPLKSDIEGGKAFANKADDFIVIHRLISHEQLWMYTMLEVVKIKDTDTGGKPTFYEKPLFLNYNFGKGFLIDGVDVIKRSEYFKTVEPLEID